MAWIHGVLESADARTVAGVVAAALSVLAYVPYALDTAAGRTSPQRASWLVWGVLSSVAVAAQIDEGALASLGFAVAQMSATLVIFALSIRRGSGAYLRGSDLWVITAAAFGLVLWWLQDNAVYALAISISVSLIGGMPTAVKSYLQHETETLSTWVVSLVASLFALVSVGSLDLVLLAYPLYLVTLTSTFVGAILLGRARRPERAQPQEPKSILISAVPVGGRSGDVSGTGDARPDSRGDLAGVN